MTFFKTFKDKIFRARTVIKWIFWYPPLTLKEVDYDTYWKGKRGDTIGALSDWQKIRADFIIKTLKDKNLSQLHLTDVACGDGSILHYIKQNAPELISKMTGLDVSIFALERAKDFGVETVEADINDPAVVEKIPQSDIVMMLEILEHIPNSETFLKKAYEQSRHGVFFSFPNTGFISYRLRLLFGRFPLQWALTPSEHLRFWTARDLKWWLKELGYIDYHIHYYKGVPFLNKIWPALFAEAFVVSIPK